MKKSLVPSSTITEVEDGYPALERLVRDRLATTPGPWFTTNAEGLFDLFLAGLPEGRRQHYNCRCCRKFFDAYGGLVTINEAGQHLSVVWAVGEEYRDVPDLFIRSYTAVWSRVIHARVTGVFVSSQGTLGTPEAGGWTHLSGPNPRPWKDRLKADNQRAAELKEEYRMVSRGLAELTQDAVDQAVRILEADALDRSEKTLGTAHWLQNLFVGRKRVVNKNRKENIVWFAVATAPPGFAHFRSGILSTLFDDLKAGLPFGDVQRRWNEKMHPAKYRRPTAPPKEGNIKKAEEVFAKLNLGPALRRRWLRPEEAVPRCYWVPQPVTGPAAAAGGLFDHLRKPAQDVPLIELPAKNIDWEKFRATVLPNAHRLEVYVGHNRLPFVALTTAEDPAAEPILQWDSPDARNPASLYCYERGLPASAIGLEPGKWAAVYGVSDLPWHWVNPERFTHFRKDAALLVEGCRDDFHERGVALFPEILRRELHEVASVIEAHSNSATLGGKGEPVACGFGVSGFGRVGAHLRVTTDSGPAVYVIDRMD